MPKGEYLQYGGQAIIEGVMMRSPRYFAVAVRAPNQQIVLQAEPLAKTWVGRQKWLKLPFLRGTLALLDAMALGIRAMHFASHIQMDDKYQPVPEQKEGVESGTPVTAGEVVAGGGENDSIKKIAVGGAMVLGIVVGLFLFVFLPNLIGQGLLQRFFGIDDSVTVNFVSNLVKVVIFLGYIWLVSRMPEIKRVFMYHGAEHKAINTLEADQALTLENCKLQTRLHPRCGTSFAIIVLLVGILIFTFVPRYPVPEWRHLLFLNTLLRFGIELLILPFIAGISYELLRFAGKFRNSGLVMALFKPGLWTQYITTVEPDPDQIEVALVALKACIEAEESHEARGASTQPAAVV